MGQIMSILGVLYINDCNLTNVVDDVSLFPPYPPFYEIDKNGDQYTGRCGYMSIDYEIPKCIQIAFVQIEEGISVCLFHFKSTSAKRVIIYSHGNAADIGCCIGLMEMLGRDLDTDYIFYDYEGYGCSDGKAKSCTLSRDLYAVYLYTKQLFKGNQIYLAGESIGSVPTCAVASSLFQEYREQIKNKEAADIPLAGVILHAALYSGATSFPGGCIIKRKDPYNNAAIVKNIMCPIFHIHGKQDEIIPYKYGSRLYKVSKSPYEPWWVEEGSHGNIIVKYEEEYKSRMLDFFAFCDTFVIPS